MDFMGLMILKDSEQKLKDRFGDRLINNHSLAKLNTFGTGGPARLFYEARTIDELASVVKAVKEIEIPAFLLGGGSNLLVSDDGFDGLVIKNSIKGIELKEKLQSVCVTIAQHQNKFCELV